ncbi:hypothetical protein SUGI_0465980 [Cryptomeria japonica]|nr:hypothetical protein SUGI_0465980 [Cryptomeria japonica]
MELWNIYDPSQSQEKLLLWDEIVHFVSARGNKKLIIVGDFNAILDLSKKCGGSKKVTNDMLNFRSFVQKLEVVDYKPFEDWFTWTNKWLQLDNIAEHLDMFLIGSY